MKYAERKKEEEMRDTSTSVRKTRSLLKVGDLKGDDLKKPSQEEEEEETPVVESNCKAYKTKTIRKLGDNLFLFIGTTRACHGMAKINRNMIVIRHHKKRKELTLVNPVRLDAEGERVLLETGSVERIVRLSPDHGVAHDRYYLHRFPRARRWAPPPTASKDIGQRRGEDEAEEEDDDPANDHLPIHRPLTVFDDAVLPGCHIFGFAGTAVPEFALLILQDYTGNLLVTDSAVQSHRDNPFVNFAVRAKQTSAGLMQSHAVIPPAWLRTVSTSHEQRVQLRREFDRLLRLDFERLIGSSGVMVQQYAKEKMVIAVEQAFPMWE
jgi:hypothetical protein